MKKMPKLSIKFIILLLPVVLFCFSCKGKEKELPLPEPIEQVEPEIDEEEEPEILEEQPAVQAPRQPVQSSSLLRGSSALSSIGGRVNTGVLDPINYENPDLDILRQMGVDQYVISFLAGEQFFKEGQFDRAMTEYNASIRQNSDFIEAIISRGNIFLRRGDFARAIEDYSRAIRLNDNRAELYNYRGFARAELAMSARSRRDLLTAIEDFSRAIIINPAYTDALINRSRSLYEIGEWDRVIEDCGRIISLEPGNASAWNRRGNAWYNKGDLNRALADYNQALAINPSLASAMSSREIVLQALSDFTE